MAEVKFLDIHNLKHYMIRYTVLKICKRRAIWLFMIFIHTAHVGNKKHYHTFGNSMTSVKYELNESTLLFLVDVRYKVLILILC